MKSTMSTLPSAGKHTTHFWVAQGSPHTMQQHYEQMTNSASIQFPHLKGKNGRTSVTLCMVDRKEVENRSNAKNVRLFQCVRIAVHTEPQRTGHVK